MHDLDRLPPRRSLVEVATGVRGPVLPAVVTETTSQLEAETLPRVPWVEQPDCAYVVPLSRARTDSPAGVLILGTGPRLELDESYRGFFHVATEQISTRIANTRLKLEAEIARERLHRLFMEAPIGICVLEGREHRFTLVNPNYYSILFGKDRQFLGKTVREALPEVAEQGFYELLDRVTQRRNRIVHTGDRQGRNRAPLALAEVKDDLVGLESVVAAIEELL